MDGKSVALFCSSNRVSARVFDCLYGILEKLKILEQRAIGRRCQASNGGLSWESYFQHFGND